jgi:phospholipase/carboxylesterase
MRQLQSARRGPVSATGLVVFLHGYGADGADLLGLADVLGPHLPGVAFMAPDAPEPCRGNPFGRQWFPIPWLDGAPEAEAEAGLRAAADDLNGWLDATLAAEGLAADRLVLLGFSQGAMMALHVAPRRAEAVAGIVAISGRLLAPERLAEARVKPPVLLVHGDADDVVPFDDMARAGRALDDAGFTVYGQVMRGTGHGISNDGLSAALAFISEVLAPEATNPRS